MTKTGRYRNFKCPNREMAYELTNNLIPVTKSRRRPRAQETALLQELTLHRTDIWNLTHSSCQRAQLTHFLLLTNTPKLRKSSRPTSIKQMATNINHNFAIRARQTNGILHSLMRKSVQVASLEVSLGESHLQDELIQEQIMNSSSKTHRTSSTIGTIRQRIHYHLHALGHRS